MCAWRRRWGPVCICAAADGRDWRDTIVDWSPVRRTNLPICGGRARPELL
jgi:hypothetical protein